MFVHYSAFSLLAECFMSFFLLKKLTLLLAPQLQKVYLLSRLIHSLEISVIFLQMGQEIDCSLLNVLLNWAFPVATRAKSLSNKHLKIKLLEDEGFIKCNIQSVKETK